MLDKLSIYKDKDILITGNTGFKGSWLTSWLLKIGANIIGYSLEPPTIPSLYQQLDLRKKIKQQYIKDIRSYRDIKACIEETKPDIIFHLAAQPLVRDSYSFPRDTFDTNVMGTVNLLEAVRELGINIKIICITSDKSYENKEWLFGYREVDQMGGHDPYSASKGIAELVISSYRCSFFDPENMDRHGVQLASVRAGNVIGGGDWAKDRIVPDCIKALYDKKNIHVRNPVATRPWQHVLEPLGGYMLLGAELFKMDVNNKLFCDAFNFGPSLSSNKPVKHLVDEILKNWGEGNWSYDHIESVHEASLLNLTIDKAYHLLKWHPVWDFITTVKNTIEWYKAQFENRDLLKFTDYQIEKYMEDYGQLLAKL